jgi:hypothetical protein
MLTPRERAMGEYNAVMAQGRRRILGVDDMSAITRDRVKNVRRAERAIRAAKGTERRFLREPDDDRLEQMLEAVSALVDTLEDDGTRWAGR